jgi:hypothetical protein
MFPLLCVVWLTLFDVLFHWCHTSTWLKINCRTELSSACSRRASVFLCLDWWARVQRADRALSKRGFDCVSVVRSKKFWQMAHHSSQSLVTETANHTVVVLSQSHRYGLAARSKTAQNSDEWWVMRDSWLSLSECFADDVSIDMIWCICMAAIYLRVILNCSIEQVLAVESKIAQDSKWCLIRVTLCMYGCV